MGSPVCNYSMDSQLDLMQSLGLAAGHMGRMGPPIDAILHCPGVSLAYIFRGALAYIFRAMESRQTRRIKRAHKFEFSITI